MTPRLPILALLLVVLFPLAASAAEVPSGAALIEAAKTLGGIHIVNRLLAQGADVNAKDLYSNTVLMVAAMYGHTAAVEALLAKGADVNAKSENEYGQTALIVAALNGHTAIVRALLEKGANVNAKDNKGQTALIVAAKNGHTAVVRALLAQGADIDATDDDGRTALDIATAQNKTLVVELLKQAASRPPVAESGETAKARAEIEKIKAETERTKAEAEKAKAEAERVRAEAEKAKAVAKKEPEPSGPVPLPDIVVDIERLPAGTVKAKQDAYAVVIGIEKYADLIPPDYAVRDAKWVKEYLIHVLGYPEENINLLVNEQATKSRVESAFETWLPNQDPKGSVFVYYSGHGAPDPATGESYLVPADGSPGDLKRTGYSLKHLAQVLGKLPAKELVVAVDSCFSGQPGTRSVIAKGTKPMVITAEGPWAALGDRGIVFTAGNQVSTVYEEKKHGLFTYFFLKGLQGAADTDGDGTVRVQELFTYLRPEVLKTAKRQNVQQEPGLWPAAEQLGPRGSRALAAVGR